MPDTSAPRLRVGRVILPCSELTHTLAFFIDTLGFVVETIFPADDPHRALVYGHGVRVELRRGLQAEPGQLSFECDGEAPASLVAPNGTRIEFVSGDRPVDVPELIASRVLTRMGDANAWGQGRAGMMYRDLIPDRLGGRFIASHIRIEEGGSVPDYAHFHRVRFQMIYCYKGWVRVVYEDQGESFVLETGDCVLQPPTIRHRVLESSAGLEVIEFGCPAQHETHSDRAIELPTGVVDPERLFGGQRFVRHVAKTATWVDWHAQGFECREFELASATGGLAEGRVVRPKAGESHPRSSDAEFHFHFVLKGRVGVEFKGEPRNALEAGDSLVIPAGEVHRFIEPSEDFEMLEVSLPGSPSFV